RPERAEPAEPGARAAGEAAALLRRVGGRPQRDERHLPGATGVRDTVGRECSPTLGRWPGRRPRIASAAVGHVREMVRLRAERTITVRMLVDTGATYRVISPRLAKALGVARLRRSGSLRLADGRRVRLGVGVAVVRIDGREAPITKIGRASCRERV